MAKITLDTVAGGYDLSVINTNFDKIEAEFQDKVLYRNNTSGEANTLETDVDANAKRIYNLPEPLASSEAARLQDVQNAVAGGAANLITFTPYGSVASSNVQAAIQELIDDTTNNGVTLPAFLKDNNAIVVDSIAALKAIDKTKFTKAQVLGYYTKGDGGGGTYWYDSTDIVSSDDGGSVIVAADGARWKLSQTYTVSVKQFGAKGDGSTNDTVAIQKAINWASKSSGVDFWETYFRRVLVPAGNYQIAGLSWSVPITLEGEGPLTTVFNLVNGANVSAITINTTSLAVATNDSYRQSSVIKNLTLNCNGANQTGTSHGIYLPDSPNLITTRYDGSAIISDVIVRAAKNSNIWSGQNRNNGALERVVSLYAGADAATFYGYDWRIDACDFGNSTSAGLRQNGGGALACYGSYFYMSGDSGIVVAPAANAPCMFDGCYVDTNAHHGVYFESTNLNYVYHSVINSTFRDNGSAAYNTYAHVYLKNLQNSVVQSNIFVVNIGTVRPAYVLFLDNTPSVIFSGVADTVNAATQPYATAICNLPQNTKSASYMVDDWTAYTPTVTAGTGTITTATATGKYKRTGKVVEFQLQVVITTNGTGATYVNATLPFNVAAGNSFFGIGRNATAGGALLAECIASTVNCVIRKYDDTYPGANATTLNVSGTYQSI